MALCTNVLVQLFGVKITNLTLSRGTLHMAQSKTITGSEIISRSLMAEGVENIFTLAGDHVLPTLDDMGDRNFKIWDTRHEQAAVHMADAWGRITNKLGVAIYTTPGLANAIPGLANAMHSEAPLLSISGCAELSELGRGAMQEIDQIGMTSPVTKGSWMVTNPLRIPDMISHAIRLAFNGRRGPVHLTIPVDIQEMSVPSEQITYHDPLKNRPVDSSQANKETIEKAISLMRSASKPLIIVGNAGSYAETGSALVELIETTKIPVMTEGNARGLIPDSHEYCFGFFDIGLNKSARKIQQADLVILLGRKQDLIVGYAMPPTISETAKIIQIDPEGSLIARNRAVDIGITGNIEDISLQLAKESKKYDWVETEWLNELNAERKIQSSELDDLTKIQSPMHAALVHQIVGRNLSEKDILVFDGGDFCHFGRAYYEANSPRSWHYLGSSGMLGQAIPTALAAKIANPDSRVIAFTGDGAFGFNGLEFDTAVRHHLPIVCIMGHDSAWGIDRHIQKEVFGKTVATDLLPSKYDQVVKALGGHGESVQHPDELPNAIERAFSMNRPSLINVQIANAISPRAQAAINKWKSHVPLPM